MKPTEAETCTDCRRYKTAGGRWMKVLCDKHLKARLAKVRKQQKPWHPTKNPISRMLRFAVIAALLVGTAQAEPRHRSRNYILRRQSAGSVSGVPTSRRIIGKRQIDIYRNGMMFEGDAVIGVLPR